MVKRLLGRAGFAFILLFPWLAGANQGSPTYRRDQMLFQFEFNEQSGTTWFDASTHAYVLNATGSGDAIVTGKHGRALSMNGSGCAALTDISGTVDNTFQDYTYEVSFYLDGSQDANGTSVFFAQDFLTDAWDLGYIIGPNGKTYLRHRLTINANTDVVDDMTGVLPISTATYHHAVFRRQSGQWKDLWLDGTFDSKSATKASSWNIAKIIEIGCTGAAGSRFVRGNLDRVTFWKTYFSDGETRQLYTIWLGRKARLLQ